MQNLLIRRTSTRDRPFLRVMLALAAHEPDVRAVDRDPRLAHLIDCHASSEPGFIASSPDPVGAVWLVSPHDTHHGFTAIGSDIPELVLAVAPEARNHGVGTRLLNELLTLTRGRISRIAISVREDNPAIRLYARAGFLPLPGRRQRNRAGSWSTVMLLDQTIGTDVQAGAET